MKTYAFTGPRKTNSDDTLIVQKTLRSLQPDGQLWLFGDAPGVDNIVACYTALHRVQKMLFQVPNNPKKQDFAIRSMKMIDFLKTQKGTLIGFLNKNCPEQCTLARPFSGHGSGTWGTIAYARSLGIDVQLHLLSGIDYLDLPEWFHYKQLELELKLEV